MKNIANEEDADQGREHSNPGVKLAIVANAPSPYRLPQHARIVRELPEISLLSVFKHEHNNSPWTFDIPEEINPVVLGPGEIMTDKNKGLNALRQRARGREIIDALDEHDTQAVIITGYNDLGMLRVIDDCNKRGRPCFMFTDSNVHGDNTTGIKRAVKQRVISYALERLDGLMPCSRRGIEFFKRFGFPGSPAFFMPHEPDYALMKSLTNDDARNARAQHGLRDDLKYINYCARMTPVKRPDLLVDAFAAIASERPDWGLVFVGGGELLETTKQSVPKHLTDRVTFTGFINGARNVAALYKCSEIHALPSTFEPWAAVIPEACAAGLAIVSSHVVGAASECVEDDLNGYTFKSGDAIDLAAKLRLATHPDNTERLKRGSAEVIRKWRERGDPIDGVRRAMEYAALMAPRSGTRPTGDPFEDWKADVEAGVNAIARL